MTRLSVYAGVFVAVLAATAMTIASVVIPEWVVYTTRGRPGNLISDSMGLHWRRLTMDGVDKWTEFPDDKTCTDDKRFCAMWRTTGWLMSVAIFAELVTLVTFVIVVAGGRLKRERGWRMVAICMFLTGVLKFCAWNIVHYLYEKDHMFDVPGYRVGTSWSLCSISSLITFLSAFGLAISAYILPPENGYEFLADSAVA